MKVVIVGGGAAGFSAATVAKAVGADVTLIERTDMLGGVALVARSGHARWISWPTGGERSLGGALLYDLFNTIITHRGMAVPGLGDKASFYEVMHSFVHEWNCLATAGMGSC